VNTHPNRRAVLAALVAAPFAASSIRVRAQETDAKALLKRASEAMAALQSFHFQLETIKGSATIMGALELKSVEGDVVRPASFQATVTAKLAVADVKVDVISIDGAVWATNPISAGEWEQISTGLTDAQAGEVLTVVLNPESIFLAAMTILEDPQIEGTDEIGDVSTTKVFGSFTPSELSKIVLSGTPTAVEDEPAIALSEDPVDLTVWIADDGRVMQIEEEGPLLESESRDVIRRFTFSNFDQPVEIQPPM
jgi:hypothetical protein